MKKDSFIVYDNNYYSLSLAYLLVVIPCLVASSFDHQLDEMVVQVSLLDASLAEIVEVMRRLASENTIDVISLSVIDFI